MQTNSHNVNNIRVGQCDFFGAQSWMERVCGSHFLQVTKPQNIKFCHSAKVFNSFFTALGFMEYGSDVTIKIEEPDCLNSYSLSLPLLGEHELLKNGHSFKSSIDSGLVASPHETQELWMAGNCKKLSVVIPRLSMRQTFEEMLDRTLDAPLRFEPTINAINGATVSWWRVVRNFAEELDREGGMFEYTLFSRDIERTSGVSRFKVIDGFKKYFGTPPMVYLKKYRLTAVRQGTLEGGPVRSLSRLATGWGFHHLGRFSIEYRKLFNEKSSLTLHRGESNRDRFL